MSFFVKSLFNFLHSLLIVELAKENRRSWSTLSVLVLALSYLTMLTPVMGSHERITIGKYRRCLLPGVMFAIYVLLVFGCEASVAVR